MSTVKRIPEDSTILQKSGGMARWTSGALARIQENPWASEASMRVADLATSGLPLSCEICERGRRQGLRRPQLARRIRLHEPFWPAGNHRMNNTPCRLGEHVVCRHRKLGPAVASHALGSPRWGVVGSKPQSFLKRPEFMRFRHVVADLRRLCPPAFPVVVRTSVVPPDLDGLAKRRRNRFVIHLDHNLRQDAAISVLLHEWAHCRSWSLMLDKAADDAAAGRMSPEEFELVSHDGSFGVAFAEIWSTFTTAILPGLDS